MLLNTDKHHYTKTRLIFTIFVSISKRGTIYVLCMWSFFHFHLLFYRDTSFFTYFLEFELLFLDDNVDEECE